MADDIPGFIPGFVYDPIRIQDVMAERLGRGDLVMASQQDGLAGSWARLKAAGCTAIRLRDAEIQLLGKHRRPHYQKFGTCTGMGTSRAIQCSLDNAIIRSGAMMRSVEVSFSAIYTMARHEIGRDRCGRGDGAILSDCAKAVHDIGVLDAAFFQGMSEDQIEQLAVKYAAPGVGTPAAWMQAAKSHTVQTFAPDTLDLLYDCIAAGYGVSYACGYVTGKPDATGMSHLGQNGPHCRAFSGIYLNEHGDECLEGCESWSAFPAAQPDQKWQSCPVEEIPCITVKTSDGPVKLAPGQVGIDAKQYWQAIKTSGECWAMGVAQFPLDELAQTDPVKTIA